MITFVFGRRATISATVATIVGLASVPLCLASEPLNEPSESCSSKPVSSQSRNLQLGHLVQSSERNWVKGRVTINAPISTVWYSVHEERKNDPDLAYSKVIEQCQHEVTLEQKFVLLPMLGSSVCVMKDIEVPLKRIDYHLIKSDRFKAMEGSWILTPSLDGKSTLLELNSHVDLGFPVPRWFLNTALAQKIDRRLNRVKKMAEKMHSGVVAQQAIVH